MLDSFPFQSYLGYYLTRCNGIYDRRPEVLSILFRLLFNFIPVMPDDEIILIFQSYLGYYLTNTTGEYRD